MKRGRQPDEATETRLVNLIVKVGDRDVASQLASHLEGLANALEADLNSHRQLIIDTVLDCARSLHSKSTVYGTLVGLLNVADSSIGREIVEGAHRELQRALEDHAPMAIRGLTRFVVALMNARVASTASTVEVLETLLSAREEEGPIARADWFCAIVMDALVLCGKSLTADAPAALDALCSRLAEHVAQRKPLKKTAPLLLFYGTSTTSEEVIEHVDALYSVLTTMREDGGWSSPFLLAPHRAFAQQLSSSVAHSLPPITLEAHTPGCTYPALDRLRLLPAPTEVDLGGRGTLVAPADRILIEEVSFMMVSAFSESHKDCAKLLVAMAEELGVDCSNLFVEVLFSSILMLPAPKHQQMYYASVMVDLCKLLQSVPIALERALNVLFAQVPRLDVELSDRLANWLAFHVSNFGFSLIPFARPWGKVLEARVDAVKREGNADDSLVKSEAVANTAGNDRNEPMDVPVEGGGATAVPPASEAVRMADGRESAHARFMSTALSRMVSLSYLERIDSRDLPSAFRPYLPPKAVGHLDWETPRDGDLEPTSAASLSASLLGKLRAKLPNEQIIAWVESELRAHPLFIPIVMQTLLHAGSKSVSHLEKLIDKFGWLLVHVAADERRRSLLIGAGVRYWAASKQMSLLLCSKLIKAGVADDAAVLAYCFSAEACPTLASSGWSLVELAISGAVLRHRDAAGALRRAERRWVGGW